MERPARHPRVVLLVDDDYDIRVTFSEVLRFEGWDVVCAANGADALEVLRRMPAPPVAILLDLMMPVMNGWEFLKLRANDPELSSIPVAVVTASPERERRSVEGLGVVAVLGKPIALNPLLDLLERLAEPEWERKAG